VVSTNLEMVRVLGAAPPLEPPPPDGRWLLERLDARFAAQRPCRDSAVILPGTGRGFKAVPADALTEVARALAARSLSVVVAWGPGERDLAESIAARAGRGVAVAPPTDLEELAALLGSARLVVGGDTGPVHLAASFGTPTVAAFTATDWRRNGPLGERVEIVSAVDLSTAPGAGSPRAVPVHRVTGEQILRAVDRVLGPVAG
jgi:ADP-heptose:LPS heptosyltransferase